MSENSFRIAVLGSFSGDGAGDTPRNRRPMQIDRDNFAAVMRKLDVRLDGLQFLPNTSAETVRFADIDDFHPDELFERLEIFASLRGMREKLQTPDTSHEAMLEIERWMPSPLSDSEHQSTQTDASSQARSSTNAADQTDSTLEETGSLLDGILDAQSQGSITAAAADSAGQVGDAALWKSYIDSIVAPYAEASQNPRVGDAQRCLDNAIASVMQCVLALPKFRQLEARWRALHLLVHRLETGPQLKVFLIDIDREGLQAELLTDQDDSPLLQSLVTEAVDTQGGEPWSLIVGDFCFGIDDRDMALLERLAAVAAAINASLLAGADLSRFGNVSNPDWQRLRHSAAAGYLALTWPRFLARLPYGPHTRPIDSFDFDEMSGVDASAAAAAPRLLWANGAYLAALVLGQAFSRDGWHMEANDGSGVPNLPLWVKESAGETEIHPCGEKLLSDTAAEQLVTLGLLPLVSVRDQDRIRLPWMVALGGKRLKGPWSAN